MKTYMCPACHNRAVVETDIPHYGKIYICEECGAEFDGYEHPDGSVELTPEGSLPFELDDFSEGIYSSTYLDDTSAYIKDELYYTIYDIIYDYYDGGYPYIVNLYADGDPTFLFDIDIDESDLSYHMVLKGLNRDDIEGLIDDFLVPETKNLNAKYTYRCERTGKLGSTAYIDIEFS